VVIDFHTHVFPQKIVEKAMAALSHKAGNAVPFIKGTIENHIVNMKKYGIDKSVVLNIATNPKQQTNVNNFAAEINSDNIIAFGSVHPDAPDAVEELYRIKELGLKGIKFHPDYQEFFVDDPKMAPIYETAAKLGFIVTFHSGVDIQYFEPVHCTPQRLKEVLPIFKQSCGKVVAAHMGGYLLWYDVEKYLVGTDIYFDTAYSYSRMPNMHAKRIIENHGADKILFGSDLPWSGVHLEKRFIESMDLSVRDNEKIMFKNALNLLNIGG